MSEDAWIGLGAQALSSGGGLFGQRKQYKNQKNLMGIQYQNQRNLNQQGHDLQFDMWNKTNYPAQLEMMKKAGLSPGLMYGLGGGGGSTTGSQGGGNASGGNAGGFNAMDVSALKMKADIDLTNAMKEKTDAEREKISGVDTEKVGQEIAESIARSSNLDADTALKLQEKTNLNTLDEWNKVKQDLDEIKRTKQVTGSTVTDMLTNLGLDPINNKEDMTTFRALVGAYLGANMLEKVMGSLGKVGVGKKAPKGITINNLNN
jgi:hypothetical protein